MKDLLRLIVSLLLFTCLSNKVLAKSCEPQIDSDELISREDFPWSQSLEQIAQLSEHLYASDKRIQDRAYIDGDSIVLPIEKIKAEFWGFNFDNLALKPSFIKTLNEHIKKIKINNFGQELIYSDIGHVHIFANVNEIRNLKNRGYESSQADFYEKILHSDHTKFLYHTSEQLGVPKNEEELWRKNNRTVIGNSKGEIKISPFTKSIESYAQFFSIYFNANKNGCFSVNETNFDISLSSPK